jgi:hypothetical protein
MIKIYTHDLVLGWNKKNTCKWCWIIWYSLFISTKFCLVFDNKNNGKHAIPIGMTFVCNQLITNILGLIITCYLSIAIAYKDLIIQSKIYLNEKNNKQQEHT